MSKTYWQFEIRVGDRCVMSAANDTLEQMIQGAFRDAIYYQVIYPDYKITIGSIVEMCSGCFNHGELETRKSMRCKSRTIRCPECKGKKASGKLADIRLEMPDAANRIMLVQSA